jgi:catechol 2,3-dioxygenase-like lactoylglutathione lyase family enzyme
MQIRLSSVLVQDQEQALEFYTRVLGFVRQADIPRGAHRWLTVIAPEGVDGVELLLEPMAFAPARTYQQALFDAGIPAIVFVTQNIAAETARLKAAGVQFRGEPAATGPIISVLFEDTCGNLISLTQPPL